MVHAPVNKLTFEEYLAFDNGTDIRYELVNGELVPMNPPSGIHARIARFLFVKLLQEIERIGANLVVDFTTGVRTTEIKSRLPDLVVMTSDQEEALLNVSAVLEEAPLLAIEIVSQDSQTRDYRHKRTEYAAREIQEYWIVDPQKAKVTVLKLVDGLYEEETLTGSDRLQSNLFPELKLTATQMLAAK